MSHAPPWPRKRNCPFSPVSGSEGNDGIQSRIAERVQIPNKETMANVPRHDNTPAMYVAAGTPIMLATVIPPTIIATAEAPRPGESREHTMAPAPKNAPWGSPEMNLDTSIVWKSGETAIKALPTVIMAARISIIRLSGIFRIRSSPGAPTDTPKAYAEISWPADGMLICISRAISPRIPIMVNSAMPRAKVPMASDSRLSFI